MLSVPLHWDLSLIQKLISSPEFSDLHAGLVELGEKVQSLERELQALRHCAAHKGDLGNRPGAGLCLGPAQGGGPLLDGSQLEDLSPQVKERLPELFGS